MKHSRFQSAAGPLSAASLLCASRLSLGYYRINHLAMKNQSFPRPRRGFSLVITMGLMLLLLLLAVGLLSLSTVTMRSAGAERDMAIARANARMALILAIGDLQKYTGPDQRVTAEASILDSSPQTPQIDGVNHPHWLGVWDTQMGNTAIIGRHESAEYLADRRNGPTYAQNTWRDQLFKAWLVSGEKPAADKSVQGESIQLVGVGGANGSQNNVQVPLVKMTKNGKTSGQYAWWVADQSLKASMGGPTEYAALRADRSSPTDGGYYNLMGAQRANLNFVESEVDVNPYDNFKNLKEEDLQKITSYNSGSVAKISTTQQGQKMQESLKKNFHDLGYGQLSVFSDPVRGGLKKDLTTMIEGPVSGIPSAASDLPAVPTENGILTGNFHNKTGPKFAHLRNWYRLRYALSQPSLGVSQGSPVFNQSRQIGWAREGHQVDFVSSRKPALQPFIADCKLQWDFSKRDAQNGVRLHLYPSVTLWNPYNTTIVGRRYLVMISRPSVSSSNVSVGGLPLISYPTGSSGGDPMWGPDASNFLFFVTEPVDFGPGEALVFTPSVTSSALAGKAVPYSGTNLGANRLTATGVPVPGANFYINTAFAANAAVNTMTSPIRYGHAGLNSSIGGDLICHLKDAGNGSSGTITRANAEGSAFPSVHRIRANYNGDASSYWWYVWNQNNHAANNATYPGFSDYTLTSNRTPPRLWYIQIRNRWYNEAVEKASIGQQWGRGAGMLYDVPSISLYNIRATAENRDAFSYYDDWTRYSPGARMVPWASEAYVGNADFTPAFVNNKNLGSPFGPAGVWTLNNTSFPLFDVPSSSLGVLSLGAFQHAQVSYVPWHPTYVIGASNADPRCDRNHTANAAQILAGSNLYWGSRFAKGGYTGNWGNLILQSLHDTSATGGKPECLQYDIAYELNNEIWDSLFLSTLPFRADSSDTGTPSLSWRPSSGQPLPMGRNVVSPFVDQSLSQLDQKLSSDWSYPYYSAAAFLMNQGGFNVNSTSVEAWKAILGSLSNDARPTLNGGSTEPGTFSRFLVPRQAINGANAADSAAAWQGVRSLSESEISLLAERICAEIKSRAPFIGLSDFVNRRLVTEANDPQRHSLMGPLQSAIEASGINAPLTTNPMDLSTTQAYPTSANAGGDGTFRMNIPSLTKSKAFAFPGHLTQGDVLQSLAPMLTSRGDTFVVRCCGEARDASNKVTARAWCEAVVQRTPNFVQSENAPETPVTLPSSPNSDVRISNPALTSVNKVFGRRYDLVSFKWLAPNEI